MAAILQVVGDAAVPTTGDTTIRGWLESVGHVVTYVSDETAENTTGYDGVVICESCASATLGAKYDTAALPIILHEGGNLHLIRMMTVSAGGQEAGRTDIDILDDTHPIFDGPHGSFTGQVAIQTAANLGRVDDVAADPAAGVSYLAQSDTSASFKTVLACESGAVLTSGNAPARRAFVFPSDPAAAALNADGIAIVKNAYVWAFEAEILGPGDDPPIGLLGRGAGW